MRNVRFPGLSRGIKFILERHLRTHIADKIASGDEIQQNEAVEELLNLYELNNIRTK